MSRGETARHRTVLKALGDCWRRIFALAGLAVLASGIAQHPAQAAEKNDLVIGITQFPSTFHPNIDSMMAKTYILAMTRRPFTAYDADWRLICMLCVKLPTIENGLAVPEKTPKGQRGIAVTYTIHPGAVWGDGTPVTTRDVLFTWKVGRSPMSGVGNMELYRRIYRIDAIDDRTFTIHDEKLTYQYNSLNDFQLLPAHLEERPSPSPPNTRTAPPSTPTPPTRGSPSGPTGSRPWSPAPRWCSSPTPPGGGRNPGFRRITVRVIGNTAALEANLLSGSIDMIAGELGLTVDQALAFEKRHGQRFDFFYKPGLVYEHIELNLDNPILKDRRVRRALIHAIDSDRHQPPAVLRPPARRPHASVSPLDWVYADDVPRYAYNPKKAAKLLAEAGWSVMRRGVRHNQGPNIAGP